jgi:hypothetical protein
MQTGLRTPWTKKRRKREKNIYIQQCILNILTATAQMTKSDPDHKLSEDEIQQKIGELLMRGE